LNLFEYVVAFLRIRLFEKELISQKNYDRYQKIMKKNLNIYFFEFFFISKHLLTVNKFLLNKKYDELN